MSLSDAGYTISRRLLGYIYIYLELYIPEPQHRSQHFEQPLAHVRRHLQHGQRQLQRLQLALLAAAPRARLLIFRVQVLEVDAVAQAQRVAELGVVLGRFVKVM